MDEKKLSVLNYPECLDEIIKYLDWLPDDPEVRKAYLENFVARVTTA